MKLSKSRRRLAGPFSNRLFLLPRPSFVCFPASAAAATAASVHQRRSSLYKPLSPPPESPPSPPSLPPPPPQPFTPEPSIAPCVTPYAPFARGSINLLTCSSNTGKTYFLTQIVRHRHRFFQDADRIRHLIYVNANNREHLTSHPWQQRSLDDDDADADNDGRGTSTSSCGRSPAARRVRRRARSCSCTARPWPRARLST